MAETALSAAIAKTVRRRGGWIMNVHGDTAGDTGIPDRIACYRGHFIAIETKHPNGTGTTSPKQRYHLERIQHAGGHAIVARTVTEVETVLDAIDEREGDRV